MKKPVIADLYKLPEDERIKLIGGLATQGSTVAFMVEDEPGKADRYVSKLLDKFPGIEVKGRWAGPVAHVISIKVGPKAFNGPKNN